MSRRALELGRDKVPNSCLASGVDEVDLGIAAHSRNDQIYPLKSIAKRAFVVVVNYKKLACFELCLKD